MPRIIEPIDSSAAWDTIEAERNTPRELSEADWELLESLAAAGGPDGDGDLMRWGLPATGRLLQLMEVPGPRLQNAVSLLLLARRDDLAESLAAIDDDRSFLAQLTDRAAEIDSERNRRPRKEPAPAGPPKPRGLPAGDRATQRWAACLADPLAALERVAELRSGEGTNRTRTRQVAVALGIETRQPVATLRAEISARLEQLEDAANVGVVVEPEPARVVITAGPPAPGPQDAAIVVAVAAEPEPAGPPPLSHEVLIAEAWAREPMRPTTAASLATWEVLTARGEGPDWRRHFGMLSDHHGPSAAAMISGVCGAPYQEVVAYGALLRERHQEDLTELRDAYSDAEGLLSDALTAPGWAWLSSGLQVRIEALWSRCRELTADLRPGAL